MNKFIAMAINIYRFLRIIERNIYLEFLWLNMAVENHKIHGTKAKSLILKFP